VRDDAAAGLAHRGGDRVDIERGQRAQVDDLDAAPVLARGGRGLSLSAQDATIPNYHTPSDTPENIDPDVVARTLETGREMIAAIDRGEAD